MISRRTAHVLLVVSMWLAISAQAAFAQCGGTERWPVKVGADAGATQVDLANPMPTLLHDLVAIPRPSIPSDDVTRVAEEQVVRVIDGHLVKFKLESGKTGDQDYHLVVTDDTLQFSPGGAGTQAVPHSFVAEIPNPNCVAGASGPTTAVSRFATQLAAVRTKFEAQFSNITGGWNDAQGVPVRITGVVFFDRAHGQTGRSIQGLEIHPILDIEFNPGSAIVPSPPPPAASALVLNPGFESGPQDWTATAGVITTDNREPSHTGTFKAWLGGYGVPHTDRLSQDVTLPAAAQAISLKFFLHISTEEQQSQPFDTLKVQVRRANGSVVTLKTFSNLQAAAGFSVQTVDLTPFKGQSIRIQFVAQEDNGSMTSFVVDDFELVIEQ